MNKFFSWLKKEWWFIPGLVLFAVLVLISLGYFIVLEGLRIDELSQLVMILGPAFVGFFILNSMVYLVRYLIGYSKRKYPAKDWFLITWGGIGLTLLLGLVAKGINGLMMAASSIIIFPAVMIVYFFTYFFRLDDNNPIVHLLSMALMTLLPIAWFFMEYYKERLNLPWQAWLRRGILILLFFLVAFGTYGCIMTPFSF